MAQLPCSADVTRAALAALFLALAACNTEAPSTFDTFLSGGDAGADAPQRDTFFGDGTTKPCTATWDQMQAPQASLAALWAVWGSGPSNVFAVGSVAGPPPYSPQQPFIIRFDGANWKEMQSGITDTVLYAVGGTGPNNVFATGEKGTVLRFDGSSWSRVQVPAAMTGLVAGVWGSPTSDDVYFAESQVLPSGYDQSSVYHHDGATWTQATTGIPWRVYSIWGASKSSIYVTGRSSTVMHFDGTAWTNMPDVPGSAKETHLTGVWGSGSNIYVCGRSGLVFRYNAGGWTALGAAGPQEFGIWGTAPNDVFVVGGIYSSSIRHFDGGKWTTMPLPTTADTILAAVWGSGPNDVFAVDSKGRVLHYGCSP
jgi:hypothetical protein